MVVGRVSALWRYPVKSMAGAPADALFAGFAGIYGDRTFAIHRAGARPGLPFLTAREVGAMLQYVPAFRDSAAMALPPNLRDAQALAPGATPLYADEARSLVDITLPS